MVMKDSWSPLTIGSNFDLCGKMLRTTNLVSLRSLAVEMKLNIRLTGTSSLWIISRANSITSPESVICQIRKEEFTYRAFCIFAGAMGE